MPAADRVLPWRRSAQAVPDDLRELWDALKRLRDALRTQTMKRHRRVNPFIEDLFDWREKGYHVTGVDVTLYDST